MTDSSFLLVEIFNPRPRSSPLVGADQFLETLSGGENKKNLKLQRHPKVRNLFPKVDSRVLSLSQSYHSFTLPKAANIFCRPEFPERPLASRVCGHLGARDLALHQREPLLKRSKSSMMDPSQRHLNPQK